MWRSIVALGCVAALGACGFEAQTAANGDDGETVVTVGFLSPTSLQDESSGTVMVPVSLSGPSENPVTVRFAFGGGTATQGADFTGTNGVLTFGPGQTDASISVTINADAAEESVETIELTLSSPTDAVLGAGTHTISISANILPRITFMAPTSSDMENVSPTLVLQLTPPSLIGGTVDYVVGGNATGGRDYTLAAGTITILPNTATYSLMLPVTDDPNDEFDETVTLTLTGSTDIVVGTGPMHAHAIVDNDSEPTLSFTPGTRTLNEDNQVITLDVALSVASGKQVQVTFGQLMAGSTAFDGSDFNYITQLAPQVLTFAPDDTTESIVVDISDDNLDEDDELAITILSNPVNATLGLTLHHDLTITDDDSSTVQFGSPSSQSANEYDFTDVTYTYNVVLSGPSIRTITVPVTVGGTASSGSDYTITNGDIPVVFSPGQTSRPIRVNVNADNSNESDETVTLQLGTPTNATLVGGPNSNRTHTIVDDD